jgi:hypothetical protein
MRRTTVNLKHILHVRRSKARTMIVIFMPRILDNLDSVRIAIFHAQFLLGLDERSLSPMFLRIYNSDVRMYDCLTLSARNLLDSKV